MKTKTENAILHDENGKTIRCKCGCNVYQLFSQKDDIVEYECNSCGAIVKGQKAKKK